MPYKKEFSLVEVKEKAFERYESHWTELTEKGILEALSKAKDNRSKKLKHQVMGCESVWSIRHYYEINKAVVDRASFCKNHIVCPSCSKRRQWILTQHINAKISELLKIDAELKVSFITFSPANYKHLTPGLKEASKFRSTIAKKTRYRTNELQKIAGGVTSIDVTKKGKGWNIHLHMIAVHREDFDIDRLQNDWDKITGREDSHLKLEKMIRSENRFSENDITQEFSIIGRSRYLTKPHELNADDLLSLSRVSKGFKFISAFGVCRGMSKEYIREDKLAYLKGKPSVLYWIDMNDGIYNPQ